MRHSLNKGQSQPSTPVKGVDGIAPRKTPVGAAVLLALSGVPHPAAAQQAAAAEQTEAQAGTLQEVLVTASRREQTLEQVPYAMTVVGADVLSSTGVTDIASLANEVPGLSVYNLGAREAGATNPIIRGINVTAAPPSYLSFRTLEQSPVGVYIGNSPIDGYFQLDDVQRIEVLRGPQGTLYGAGALGGALRIIPNAPQLDKWSGSVELGGGTVAHSGNAAYTADGVLNVPLGDTLAFRASGKYEYDPGFIDVYGILERTGSPLSGIPVLANPAEPLTSSGIFTGKSDWNDQSTFTGRASLLWQPLEALSAQLAYIYAYAHGDGGPIVNSAFPGGPYPLDPRITFPAGGNYQDFSPIDQPWSRRTDLTSLDLSYDAGFATVSATSSYFTTRGQTMMDQTYGLLGVNVTVPGLANYYAGTPLNPRWVNPSFFQDSTHTFTQEIRLVSKTAPDKLFDYVLGVFYEKQGSAGQWNFADPGSPEYSVAEGCTGTYFIGLTFPNCLVVSGPGDVHFHQADDQQFTDKSVFGELTWHFTSRGQLTVGARHFNQDFSDQQAYDLYYLDQLLLNEHSTSASKTIWKVNPSYEYASNQYVYALWSQGFRRGGANALPLTGLYAENPILLSYGPDTTNNYEIGLKGRITNAVRYTFDVFDIEWDKPQIAGTLPTGNLAVWNGTKARSTGFEFDLTTPLVIPGLSLVAGGSYAEAKFTENYFYAADAFGNISGSAGQQLPGSAKVSLVATIRYDRSIVPGYDMSLALNDTDRSGEYLGTFPLSIFGQTGPEHVSGMNLVNASATVTHEAWRLGLYVTNLADRRIILAPPYQLNRVDNLTDDATINRPREVDLRLRYSF